MWFTGAYLGYGSIGCFSGLGGKLAPGICNHPEKTQIIKINIPKNLTSLLTIINFTIFIWQMNEEFVFFSKNYWDTKISNEQIQWYLTQICLQYSRLALGYIYSYHFLQTSHLYPVDVFKVYLEFIISILKFLLTIYLYLNYDFHKHLDWKVKHYNDVLHLN